MILYVCIGISLSLSLSIYIYIYTYMHTHIIYICNIGPLHPAARARLPPAPLGHRRRSAAVPRPEPHAGIAVTVVCLLY